MEGVNIFLYGLSGAGKDTIANYLRDEYYYLKLRIAGTIKQYVFETYGFKTQDEFEQAKRSNKDVRLAHNNFGRQYDKEGIERSNREATFNRIQSLIDRTALEFEIMEGMDLYENCIVDVRTFDEARMLLEAGYMGIFLTRRNVGEVADATHKTEQGLFGNNQILELPNSENIFIIRNHDNAASNDFGWYGKDDNGNPVFQTFDTDGTNEDLLETVDICMGEFIKRIKE